ncbi:hypothetical protein FJTKL_05525 [Diaporthe vaccinii]|uniref:Ankyrin repeat protein n=1 Tax=Diaporthe vaccinii TaxID=105482 RepID=A0ABR4FG78_9PEZI
MSKKTYAIFPDAPFTNWTKEKTTPDRYRPQGDIGPRSMLHDHLTLLESLEEKLHSAQTIVEMNREVVNQITDYFDELTCSATLQSRMDLGPFGEDVSMFFRDIKMLYRRLGNQQERLQNLLWLLARRRAEEQRSLGEQRMSSAEQLQHISNQLTTTSRRESVSMHAVTILTLIFLPATFVATFFSTGVLQFDEVLKNEEWGTSWFGLQLFFQIASPIALIKIVGCGYFYYLARRRSSRHHAKSFIVGGII